MAAADDEAFVDDSFDVEDREGGEGRLRGGREGGDLTIEEGGPGTGAVWRALWGGGADETREGGGGGGAGDVCGFLSTGAGGPPALALYLYGALREVWAGVAAEFEFEEK